MRITRLKTAGIVAGIAVLSLIGTSASAGSTSGTDGNGVDYDPSCLGGDALAGPGSANNVPSPGNNSACLVGTYDGSTESTDLTSYSLSTNGVENPPSNTQLVATWAIDGPVPPAGSTCNPALGGAGCADLPGGSSTGFTLWIDFQNPARQYNGPTNNVGGGCSRVGGGQIYDQHKHWLDGNHHFIAFAVSWDGTKWVRSARIGTHESGPDGGYRVTELGVNKGSGWQNSDPAMQFGTNWDVSVTTSPSGPSSVTVTVDGVVGSSNALCVDGVFYTVYAKRGDPIWNVKGYSTVDATVSSPVTVAASLVPGFSDVTSVGGFIFLSDITAGNSGNFGVIGSTLQPNRAGVSYTDGFLGTSDTLGDSPACPTPTFGGLLPTNPFLNPAFGCQYDDDNIPVHNPSNPAGPWVAIDPGERGTFLPEWWDTNHSFTA